MKKMHNNIEETSEGVIELPIKKQQLETNKIYYEDCKKGMQNLPEMSIDHFYADPPFNINFSKKESMYNRKKKHVIKGYKEPNVSYYEFSKSWIEQCYKILKENGSGWICSGWSNLKDVLRAIDDCGFTIVNHVIWKYQFGVYTKKKFITSHYHLLFVVKNPKQWYFDKNCRWDDVRDKNGNINYRDRQDVWTINRPYNNGKDKNANTQPPELVRKAIEYTTKKGDVILDPFMGGATTAVVCILLERNYIGFEINKNLEGYQNGRIVDAYTEKNTA